MAIYSHPHVYDLAFSYRDYSKEVDALMDWYHQFSSKSVPGAVLELAAGPSRHAIEFAMRGVSATALDSAPEMCAYARDVARAARVSGFKAALGDIRSFSMSETFDLGLLLLDSVAHLHTRADFVRHLRAVGAHVRANGLYVIEAGLHLPDSIHTKQTWQILRGEDELRVVWRPVGPDARRGVVTTEVKMTGRIGGHRVGHSEVMLLRMWSRRSLLDAVRESECFQFVREFGSFSSDQKPWRRFLVLRRRLERA
jgi:SAM-dependent methyltransferase